MLFLFRAAFWIAVVAAFAPAGLAGFQVTERDDASIESVLAAGQDIMAFCADMPAICDAGREATVLLGGMADATTEGVNHWLETREEAEPRQTVLADSGA
ncbi:MAG: hypothetical protein CMF74_08430 [Maricaulis sp.]|jgi:hypothetical protein|nr:hypothetical protein [Maricaulis sp.]HAQ35628.1 hypothetical protein [Alphaproteobacteria bacterium]|tara:strand:+ start:312 stop:611 length:300 start_codon:yes stop_codon:yes gene_type:complete